MRTGEREGEKEVAGVGGRGKNTRCLLSALCLAAAATPLAGDPGALGRADALHRTAPPSELPGLNLEASPESGA